MDPAQPPDAESTARPAATPLADLEARLEWLRAMAREQRQRLREAEESMAKDAEEFRDRSAALRTERTAIRARIDDFLAKNPRLPHLIPLRQGFALHSVCASL